MDLSSRATWEDDPVFGLFAKKILHMEEVIGCKGRIDGVPYVFDQILQVGRNVIICQLTNLNTCSHLIRGLGRGEFDPVYDLHDFLRKVTEGTRKFTPEVVMALCDRVLESFPMEEIALFNKGVALFIEKDYVQAHACFGKYLDVVPGDVITLLYDSVSLAAVGEDRAALQQFGRAHELSEEQCREHLATMDSIRRPLLDLIERLIRLRPEETAAENLWLRCFPPQIEQFPG